MDLLSPGTTFPGLIDKLIGLINATIPVLIAAGLVFFFIGLVKYIQHRGKSDERKMMMWSLVALFVILSVWGILRLACASLTGSSSCGSSGAGINYNETTGQYQQYGPPGGGGVWPI